MSLELTAHKDALSFSPIVNPADDVVTYSAQVITHHRAPELYEMIFGTTTLPVMRKPRRLRIVP
jgi:hypothetical protein